MNKAIVLANRPKGKPVLNDFKFIDEKIPTIKSGELLLKTLYVSVDPYLRGRMSDAESYVEPFELNEPIVSGVVAEVIDSKNEKFATGEYVCASLEWKEYQTSDGNGLLRVNSKKAPLSAYLGVLGMTGITAYLGLTEIGHLKKGETLVVSGASGAVGSVAGQIGKVIGCRVVGIAGSDEKVELLRSQFGFDEGINYKTTKSLSADIAKACPEGVDVYFDNVAGEISEVVHSHINTFSRIIICGAISLYNVPSAMPLVPAIQPLLLTKRALMQGFIMLDYQHKFPEVTEKLSKWFNEGKLENTETIVNGFDAIPQAFLDLFEGKNKGKMIVKV